MIGMLPLAVHRPMAGTCTPGAGAPAYLGASAGVRRRRPIAIHGHRRQAGLRIEIASVSGSSNWRVRRKGGAWRRCWELGRNCPWSASISRWVQLIVPPLRRWRLMRSLVRFRLSRHWRCSALRRPSTLWPPSVQITAALRSIFESECMEPLLSVMASSIQ